MFLTFPPRSNLNTCISLTHYLSASRSPFCFYKSPKSRVFALTVMSCLLATSIPSLPQLPKLQLLEWLIVFHTLQLNSSVISSKWPFDSPHLISILTFSLIDFFPPSFVYLHCFSLSLLWREEFLDFVLILFWIPQIVSVIK